ncbi:hypothetical protein DXG01_004707 [Tephrocybe rancida]|nr:hypothetical protein DXG01_004707 [Tephrocybe rancida]
MSKTVYKIIRWAYPHSTRAHHNVRPQQLWSRELWSWTEQTASSGSSKRLELSVGGRQRAGASMLGTADPVPPPPPPPPAQDEGASKRMGTRAANKSAHPGAIVVLAQQRSHAEMEVLRAQQAAAAQEAEDTRQEALCQVAQLEDEMRHQDIERDATANHPLTVSPVEEGRNKRRRGGDDGEYFDDRGQPSDSIDSGPESEEEVAIVPPKQRKKKVKTRRADIDAARVAQPASGMPDANDVNKFKQKPNIPAPAKKQKPSKPTLSGLVTDWQGHRSRNVSTASSASSGAFFNIDSGVGYGSLVPDNKTGDVEWPSTPGLNKESSKLVMMIKVLASSHHAPTTKKAACGGSHKWTHSHLRHGTVALFKDSVVRLARIKAGTKEPWSGLTTTQVQEIVDEVFGAGKYHVTDTDVWCGLIAYRLNDWRAMFGQQGIKTVTRLIKDNLEALNTTAAIAEAIREYLWVPDGEQLAAFLWREFNGGKAKKGLLQLHLILRVFAHAHLVLFDDPLDAICGEHKPVGALLLAMQATGELEEDRTSAGHFSYDNYGNKTMQDKKTKQFDITCRATRLLPSLKQFDDSHWRTLIIAAMEHLEDLAPAKNRASTSSHPNSEIVDANDEILLMSDPVDKDSVMEPYSHSKWDICLRYQPLIFALPFMLPQ